MSSRKASAPSDNKAKGFGSGPGINSMDQVQLTQAISDLSIPDNNNNNNNNYHRNNNNNNNTQEAGWAVFTKKPKNRAPSNGSGRGNNGSGRGNNGSGRGNNGTGRGNNVWGRGSPNPNPNPNPSPWPVTPDPRQRPGRGNPRPQLLPVQYMGPPGPGQAQPVNPVVPPSLAQGWNWAARARPAGAPAQPQAQIGYPPQDYSDPEPDNLSEDEDDDDDDEDEYEDDDMADDSDGYDSDASRKSFGTRKQNKWFKAFFDEVDRLTVEEINEQTRQWHCPGCANGPGAIEWYKGLQPLMTHAKTKGATRVKLHRELASLLEEELRRRGTSVIPVGEQFGKWKGLQKTTTDHEIVWPPMVVIMNTQLGRDDNDKVIGMGNQELLDYFSTYAAKKARHSYGPKGHRGMSLLIFDSDAVGYMEAERLHKHFESQGTDREAWTRCPKLFLPGGQRQLYGFLSNRDDLEVFNQHCQGKTKLKYEMRSYQEMVVSQMRQMNEDNQQLHFLQRKVVKQEQRSKVMEQSFDVVSKRLRDSAREIALVRHRTRAHHLETQEEMDNQEGFFKDQIEKVHKAIEDKERDFENLLSSQRARTQDQNLRKEELERFIAAQDKGVEEFEKEKDEMIKAHEDQKMQLRREFLSKEVELEKQLDDSLTALMEKYKASTFRASSSSN